MKRIISLLLVLALCLPLCACGKSKAVSNVESLIGAIGEVTVDSEAALVEAEEAYKVLTEKEKEAVENYADLVSARTVLDKALEIEQFRQSILGEWVAIDSDTSIISFDENGNCLFEDFTTTYETDGERIFVSILGMEFSFTLEEDEDGILHLSSEEVADFVRREDWEHFQPEAVAITTENWLEYFEIRENTALVKNAFGECTQIELWYGIYLKEEYLTKFASNLFDFPSKVTFEVEYNRSFNKYTVDLETTEYTIGNALPVDFGGKITEDINANWDGANRGRDYVDNPFSGNFVASVLVATLDDEEFYINGMRGISYSHDFNVLRATGTIYLNP